MENVSVELFSIYWGKDWASAKMACGTISKRTNECEKWIMLNLCAIFHLIQVYATMFSSSSLYFFYGKNFDFISFITMEIIWNQKVWSILHWPQTSIEKSFSYFDDAYCWKYLVNILHSMTTFDRKLYAIVNCTHKNYMHMHNAHEHWTLLLFIRENKHEMKINCNSIHYS